jgi:hypothetical protein
MIDRCTNPNSRMWHRYGGRGIRVCDRWRAGFWEFFADVGPRPSPKHTLDRIDNDGHYEPGNVRWAMPKQQSRNTRTNKLVEYKGERKPLAEWAEILGMSRVTLGRRLRLPGWSVERAFTEPVDISQRRVRAIPDNAGVTFRLGQPAGDRVEGE